MQFLPYKTSVILSIFFSFFFVVFSSQEVYAGSKTITVNFNENDIKHSKQKEYDIVHCLISAQSMIRRKSANR